MEVAINKCYGGFSLSNQGEEFYLNLIGKKPYFYKQTKYHHREGIDEYTRIDNNNDDSFLCFTLLKDLGKIVNEIPDDDEIWFSGREIPRNDKNLIMTIRELGEKANGMCANLKIIEIPDGIEYIIDEYDGMESISESHRSWG
jgi:hypothetical protein